jgi:MFS family permease
MDRLPWSRFHWLVVTALGTAWILDGLEIQMASTIASVLQDKHTLHLSSSQAGSTASFYLAGEVVGALVFGRLADRLGRRRLFMITLGVYLLFSGVSGFAFDYWSFILLRFIAGMGIGGEYAAVNSAIDELIPARYRGRVDIIINGTYWAGALIAASAQLLLLDPNMMMEVRPTNQITYRQIASVMLREYPTRSVLGFSLMVTQSFLYNAIFFSYALVLAHFFKVPDARIPLFFLPFALGNLLGPITLGHLFDTLGRRKMIAGTYLLSSVILAVSGYLFWIGALNAVTQTMLWCVVFFFASAGASSGYLTVSEIFPVELRSQAISFFFAISQLCGGVLAPWLFGVLIGNGTNATPLFIGYLVGAGLMSLGGLVAAFLGVDAEGRSLEDIASPLTLVRRQASEAATAVRESLGPRAQTKPV